jgi:DNA-binding HxlR family transcriptional regulator
VNNRPELRILDQNCGTRKVLELLSPKWRILILCALGDGPHRYNDLLKRIDGIAQKVLTQSLKGMEADGLIIRRSNSTPPKGVVYTLAPLGTRLNFQLHGLCEWAENHVDELDGQ